MEILVFLPGILGSSLSLPDGEEVWPPTPFEALRGYRRIDKLLRADLAPSGIVERVCIDVYGAVLDAFQELGYAEDGGQRRLVKHAYDWRRDLADLSDELGERLRGLAEEHGPEVEIKLVCHSMGGLVARGWLEGSPAAREPWARAVKLAIFLATPHEGAPLSFARAVGVGGSSLGLNPAQLRRLAEAPGYPTAYQLFPPANLLPLWRLDDPVPFKGLSLFDPAVAANYGLNREHLAATTRFHARLDPARRPESCRYFSVVSAAHETVTRLDQDSGEAIAVTVKSAGDGTVPIQSATALRVQTAYVEANHVGVAQKRLTHKLIGMLLGARLVEPLPLEFDVDLSGFETAMNLSLSERIIAEGEDYEIVVTTTPKDVIDVQVRIRKESDGSWTPAGEIPIVAQSRGVERISIKGPLLAVGHYAFDLVDGAGTEYDSEELLVSGQDDG